MQFVFVFHKKVSFIAILFSHFEVNFSSPFNPISYGKEQNKYYCFRSDP